MAKAVVFRTPGHIPIEAFTMVGVNSKPSTTNPIGFFGTGLKYAVAVLLRLGCKVTVFIGQTEYVFEVKTEDFRGKEFQFVYLKKRNGHFWNKPVKLPFTLEYGKTWEVWQAYRELHSNTLDENGAIEEFAYPEDWENDKVREWSAYGVCVKSEESLLIVEGEIFLQAYYDRYKTFLQDGLRVRNSTDYIQVIDKPSRHIYYRGMRVYDLPDDKLSKQTYNFLKWVDLTEDRTAKHPFLLERDIAEYVAQSDDKEFIRELARCGSEYWEDKLDFRYANAAPSTSFRSVARMPYASASFGGYYKSHTPEPVEPPPFTLNQVLHAFDDLIHSRRQLTSEMVDCVKKYLAGKYAEKFMRLEADKPVEEADEEVIF